MTSAPRAAVSPAWRRPFRGSAAAGSSSTRHRPRRIPVLVGGGGERKTLRYTAEHADIWHGFGDAATIARKSGILDGHCADLGRDPAEIERSCGVQAPPERVADALQEAGVTLFTVGIGGPDYDMGLLRQWIRWRDERRG